MFQSWFTYEALWFMVRPVSSTLIAFQRSFIPRIVSMPLSSSGLCFTTVEMRCISSPMSRPITYGFSVPLIS